SDTGSGIPRQIIDRIFDPFFTTKEFGRGSGLGLSSVLGIVTGLGGFIEVESAEGKGTVFKVYIPARDHGATVPTAQSEPPIPPAHGELILLVDDEPNIRTVAEMILQQAGYEVLLAADGTEALAQFAPRRRDVCVVITDAVMPYLDGASLVRALRKLEPNL